MHGSLWPLLPSHTEHYPSPLASPHTFSPRWASEILSLTLIDRHWLSLHRSNKQSCWTPAHQSRLGPKPSRGAHSSLTSSSSIFPPLILLAGWVTSWQSCWPCARKFTAWCNHLLCSKHMMLELLHLLESAALYCKCAISIHEGIYMHSQAMLPVFISCGAHCESYGVPPSSDGFPRSENSPKKLDVKKMSFLWCVLHLFISVLSVYK